jgi:undecaprenyl diphosphate synthase
MPEPANDKLPRHIAVIMDGNGRWARQRGLARIEGHKAGIESVRAVVTACAELGVGYLTLFAFSTENWKRPKEEVDALMGLLVLYMEQELPTMMENNVSFHAIGRLEELHPAVQEKLKETMAKTAGNTGLYLTLALNYSGRTEILDAVGRLLADGVKEADEAVLRARFYDPALPDPDLLIRTSGEMRVSNFFLWQLAYAELHITPVHWPDFRREHLLAALADFAGRERRFGGLG